MTSKGCFGKPWRDEKRRIARDSFSSRLQEWQGNRTDVECAKLLGVSYGTFYGWKTGVSAPRGGEKIQEVLQKVTAECYKK